MYQTNSQEVFGNWPTRSSSNICEVWYCSTQRSNGIEWYTFWRAFEPTTG